MLISKGKFPPLWGGTRVQGSALGFIPFDFKKSRKSLKVQK
jgi:hypothetical protein